MASGAKKKNRNAADRTGDTDAIGVQRRQQSLDGARQELQERTGDGQGSFLEQARATTAAHEARIREELEDDGRALVDEHGVPIWCVRVHHRIGHLGGAVVWALLVAAILPAVVAVIWAVLLSLGVTLVAELAPVVLSEMGASAELVSSRTDSFLFSWVMPVLFFVLVLAGVTLWLLKAVAQWLIDWGRRLALGLFAGYGMGPVADWKILRARRAANQATRAADRRLKDKELAAALASQE